MAKPTTQKAPPPKLPTLEPGDHLTRDEFERRYEAMPHVKKAELIEGVVYMPSPVRANQHATPHGRFMGWLWHYEMWTPGVLIADNATVRLDLENEPQPDGLLMREPGHGGRAVIGSQGYIEGAPELVGEITASTASFDLHTKLRVYRRNQVQEYIVWRVGDAEVDWFVLHQGDYARLALSPNGIYQSEVFPGLWLEPAALVRGDSLTVLRVLQEGIASPEHAAFVAELQRAAGVAK